MTMTTRAPKTPEQRREEMEALHARLDEQVETLRTSEGWAAYLRAARSFHRYSLSNLLLIMAQDSEATQVAGYRAWQAKGRQVRKGEKALAILGSRLAPAGPRASEGEDGEGIPESGKDGRPMRRVFFPVKVFDVAQTEAIEGAEQMPTATRDLAAEDHAGLYERVAAHFERTGVALRRTIVPGTANGFCRKIPPAANLSAPESAWVTEVVVDERRTGADAARTALHEAAHIAAGHLEGADGDYVAHRGRVEIEAEGATFIVAAIAGLDTSPVSTGYVASWMSESKAATLKATAGAALAAAKVLTAALGLDQDEEDREAERQPVAA